MEPIGYNPNLSGWWGSKILDSNEWLIRDKEKNKGIRIIRASKNRFSLATTMYQLLERMANRGVTHIHHIITQGTDGGPLELMSFREFKHRYGNSAGTPCTQEPKIKRVLMPFKQYWREQSTFLGREATTLPKILYLYKVYAKLDKTSSFGTVPCHGPKSDIGYRGGVDGKK